MYSYSDIVDLNQKFKINVTTEQKSMLDSGIPRKNMRGYYSIYIDFFSTYKACPADITENLHLYLHNLNVQAIKNTSLVDNIFYNDMACITSSFYDNYYKLPLYKLTKVADKFTNITDGANNTFGDVITVEKDGVPFYVMKSLKPDKISSDIPYTEIYHEAFIGIVALNLLRKYIPNFMQTYGIYYCNNTISNLTYMNTQEKNTYLKDDKKSVIKHLCTSDSPKNPYIISEYIKSIGNLYEACVQQASISPGVLLIILIQIFNALKVANDFFDYTHYDLHPGNILIEYHDRGIYQPIYLSTGLVYVYCKYVPRIIDYGFSHIKKDNVHIGYASKYIKWKESDASYDINKLILLLYTWLTNNTPSSQPLLTVLANLYSYIGNGTIDAAVERYKDNYYYPEDSEINYSYERFINNMLDLLPIYEKNYRNVFHYKYNPPIYSLKINSSENDDIIDTLLDNNTKINNLRIYVMLQSQYDDLIDSTNIKDIKAIKDIKDNKLSKEYLFSKYKHKILQQLNDFNLKNGIKQSIELITIIKNTLNNNIFTKYPYGIDDINSESFQNVKNYIININGLIYDRNLYGMTVSSLIYIYFNTDLAVRFKNISDLQKDYIIYIKRTDIIIKSTQNLINNNIKSLQDISPLLLDNIAKYNI